jgi:hypothetical protein
MQQMATDTPVDPLAPTADTRLVPSLEGAATVYETWIRVDGGYRVRFTLPDGRILRERFEPTPMVKFGCPEVPAK